MKTDGQLIKELKEATSGLAFMSESDYPLEVVRWKGVAELTSEALCALTGQEKTTRVEAVSAADFFRAATSEPDWKGEEELKTARRFQKLLRLLEENLKDLKAFRMGEIDMPVYVVGRAPSGNVLGVSTRVVET